MVDKEKSQISPAAESSVAEDSICLTGQERKLLQTIRESEDPTVLLQVALDAAEDCLRRLEQSE